MQANSSPVISTALRKRLDSAARVFALTGAGISAESGVPTFRGGGQAAVWKGMPFNTIWCSGRMRSAVVLFGEMLPIGVLEEAAEHARRSDVCFRIGTSGAVYTAAGLAHMAKETGAFLV